MLHDITPELTALVRTLQGVILAWTVPPGAQYARRNRCLIELLTFCAVMDGFILISSKTNHDHLRVLLRIFLPSLQPWYLKKNL